MEGPDSPFPNTPQEGPFSKIDERPPRNRAGWMPTRNATELHVVREYPFDANVVREYPFGEYAVPCEVP